MAIGIGRVLSGVTKTGFGTLGRKSAVAAGLYLGYKGIKGFYDEAAPSMIDGAMDVAFGSPEADRQVLGTDLTPSMLYAGSGLPLNELARAKNYARFGADIGPAASVAMIPAMGAVGAAGVVAGGKIAGKKAGVRGAIIGGIAGGFAGGMLATENVVGTAIRNREIIGQSPFYNQSLLTAERLNASGNIVLRHA